MKSLFSITLLTRLSGVFIIILLSVVSNAQTPTTTQSRGIFLYNGSDTIALKNIRTNLQATSGNTGGLIFDKANNKWRVWNGTTWVNWNLFNPSSLSNMFWALQGESVFNGNVTINGLGNGLNMTDFSDFAIVAGNAGIATSNGEDIDLQSNTGEIRITSQGLLSLNSNGGADIRSLSKHYFTAVTNAVAPLNLGVNTALPGSLESGDIGHITNIFYGNTNSQTYYFAKSLPVNITINNIPYYSASTGSLTSENTFQYDAVNNFLYAGGSVTQSPNDASPSFTINSGTNKSLQITADGIGDITLISSGTGLVRIVSPPTIQAALATGNTNTEILTLDPVTDRVEIRDASTLVPTLTATQIGFGSGSNLLTSDPTFNWDNATKVITIGTLAGVHSQWQDEALEFNNGVTFIGGLDYSGSVFRVAGTAQLNLEATNGPLHIRYDGSGTNADLVITDITGSMRSNCTGAPSGAVYNNGDGILRICP